MKEYINEFLAFIINEKKYSNHTKINYEIDLAKYIEYLNKHKKDFLTIKYQDISEYIINLKKSGYKSSTINRNISTLRSFYHYLLINKKIKTNPFTLIKSVKTEKKLPNYFKETDFLTMLEVTENNPLLHIRNVLILELLLATGLRVSELVNIKLNDINGNEIKCSGKGSKERIVIFGKIAKEKLKDYLNNSRNLLLKNKTSDYLFINHLGDPLTDRGVRLIIEKIIKKTAIKTKISPHTFRHSFATMMLNNGGNIKSVQELLGHASLNTTSIYTHLTNEEVRRAYLNAHPRAKKE